MLNNFYGISNFEEQIVVGNSTIKPTEIITSNLNSTDAYIGNLTVTNTFDIGNSSIKISGNITVGNIVISQSNSISQIEVNENSYINIQGSNANIYLSANSDGLISQGINSNVSIIGGKLYTDIISYESNGLVFYNDAANTTNMYIDSSGNTTISAINTLGTITSEIEPITKGPLVVNNIIDNQWKSVTYSNGKFVAVGSSNNNRAMYSTDGITWTLSTAAEMNSWLSITYGNGKFVAVASSGTNRVMYSTDGITWVSASAAEQNQWQSVTYGDGKFVAVSLDGTNRVMYSTDGITWTSTGSSEQVEYRSVTYGNGKFVAVASSGGNRVMYSTDGITWNVSTASEINSWYSVTYGEGKFVAVGTSGTNRVMYSLNGINWTSGSIDSHSWRSIGYGYGLFVAGDFLGRVATSTDGITFILETTSVINVSGITYGNDKFVIVGATRTSYFDYYGDGSNFLNFYKGNVEVLSADINGNITCTNILTGNIAAEILNIGNSIISLNGNITNLASSNISTQRLNVNGNIACINANTTNITTINLTTSDLDINGNIACMNGTMLSNIDPIVIGPLTSTTPSQQNIWQSVTYGDGIFVAVASSGNRAMYSEDGITWVSTSTLPQSSWQSITYGNGKFVAVAASGFFYAIYSTDGINWSTSNYDFTPVNAWTSVTYGNGLFVAVCYGGINQIMYSADAIIWESANADQQAYWQSIAYGDGKFVAVSLDGTGRFMYSTDAMTWTISTIGNGSSSFQSITYGNGKFVAVASSGTNRAFYSYDGITWTACNISFLPWYVVTYGNGAFIAVSLDQISISTDGVTFTTLYSLIDTSYRSAVYGKDKFVFVRPGDQGYITYYTGNSNFVELYNGNTEVCIVDNNGNIFCNNITTTDIDLQNLNVNGSINLLESYVIDIVNGPIPSGSATIIAGNITISSENIDIGNGSRINLSGSGSFVNGNTIIQHGNIITNTLTTTGTIRANIAGSSNVMDLNVSNTNVFTILNNGNVGIGTNNPTERFHVSGNTLISNILSVGTQGQSSIVRRGNSDGSYGLFLSGGHNITNTNSAFLDSNFGASIALSSGNPATDPFGGSVAINAWGNISPSQSGNSITFNRRTATNTLSESMRINHLGNVGINTTNPIHRLDIKSANVSMSIRSLDENQNASIFLGTPWQGSDSNALKAAIIAEGKGSFSKSRLHFCLDNTDNNSTANNASVSNSRMTIDSTGFVGIGTTSPQNLLSLSNNNGNQLSINNTTTGSHFNVINWNTGIYNNFTSRNNAIWQFGLRTESNGTTNSQDRLFMGRAGISSSDFVLARDGSIGIGTSNPQSKLEVNGDGRFTLAGTSSKSIQVSYNNSSDSGQILAVHDGVAFKNVNFPFANVGIGSTSPIYKFVVNDNSQIISSIRRTNDSDTGILEVGQNTVANAIYIGWEGGYPTVGYRSIASNIRLKTDGTIIATLAGPSDSRIKTNIVDINDGEAIEKIRLIEPKKYEYINKKRSTNTVFGFIAQQIKQVIPEAVTDDNKEFIPDIYSEFPYDPIEKIVTIENHNLTINDKLRIVLNDGYTLNSDIEIVDENTFKLLSNDLKLEEYINDKIFIFGKFVEDFNILDKNYIFTLNVCATQELDRQLQEAKATIQNQQNQINELLSRIIALENK